MPETKRRVLIAGNWKMHKTIEEAKEFIKKLLLALQGTKNQAYLAVPFTAIHPLANEAKGTNIVIGAQNMNDASEGAFTGEIAGKMLKEAGARFVLLGHSERRHLFNESSKWINRKVKRALADGLEPILCIGETKEEHQNGKAEEVLKDQLLTSLEGIDSEELQALVLAYEPVWAIGTGMTASPQQAQEMHAFCRGFIAEKWGNEVAQKMTIIYGGSVSPQNVRALLEEPDIDGVLVGGASLKAESFAQIVNDQKLCTTKGKS